MFQQLFSMTTFLTALLITVKLNFSDAPRHRCPYRQHPSKFVHIFGKGAGARGGDGGERGQSLITAQ